MPMSNFSQSLTKEQKTGFVLLLLFGVLSVALGFLQLRNTIYTPFVIRLKDKEAPLVTFEDEASRLQKIDTDQDGINDYRELEFFQTSPYLADTDSDGIDDKEEIDSGSDPLCPQGKICGSALPSSEIEAQIALEQKALGSGDFDITQPNLDSGAQEDILKTFSQSNPDMSNILNDPDQLRALLSQSGVLNGKDLQGISDAELLQLTQETLQKQQIVDTSQEILQN